MDVVVRIIVLSICSSASCEAKELVCSVRGMLLPARHDYHDYWRSDPKNKSMYSHVVADGDSEYK